MMELIRITKVVERTSPANDRQASVVAVDIIDSDRYDGERYYQVIMLDHGHTVFKSTNDIESAKDMVTKWVPLAKEDGQDG